MNESPPDNLEVAKHDMEQIYIQALEEMGISDIATFGGFFREENNSRAKAGWREVMVNEAWLDIPQDEAERVARHEAQHIVNSQRLFELDEQGKGLFAFVLHPNFIELHGRLESTFNTYKQQGYPFKKIVKPIPARYADIEGPFDNYAHPDELLALLRGYEQYLKQVEQGVDVNPQPYEFIDAFKPEDLALLDEQYRFKLATEVLNANPTILDTETDDSIFEI
jgi:hypothetical protein